MHIFDSMKQNLRTDLKNESTESICIERIAEKIRVIYLHAQIVMILKNYLSFSWMSLTSLQTYTHPRKIFPKTNSYVRGNHGLHLEFKNLYPLKDHYFSSFIKLKDPT